MADWGSGMLQSRREFLIVSTYGEALGLRELAFKIQNKANFKLETMQPFRLAISAEFCYGSVGVEITRKYLDSGPLDEAFTSLIASERLGENVKNTQLITLAAAVMTLGCTIDPKIMKDLKKLVQVKSSPAFRTQEARLQMQNAVLSYVNGTPYEFGNVSMNEGTIGKMFTGATMVTTNVGALKHLKMTCPNGKVIDHIISAPDDEEAGVMPMYPHDVCAACGFNKVRVNGSERLLVCGKCNDRQYCSKACQRKHWSLHKPICSRPKEEMEKFLNSIPLDFAGDAHPNYNEITKDSEDEAPLLVSGNALGGLGRGT